MKIMFLHNCKRPFTFYNWPIYMKRFLLFSLVNLIVAGLLAQSTYQINNDSTAVPFLRISPDSRAGGMGDGGVACASDPNAIHWNLSNLAFAKRKFALAISYTPWLRALVPDVNHAYIGFYVKPDSVSAVGASVRYFSLGNLSSNGVTGTPTQFRPNEFAFDVGYTRMLSQHFSAGITARFIQSNPSGINGIVVRDGGGRACAGDISIAWKGRSHGDAVSYMQPSVGAAITNIGSKMWYEDRDSAEFLPTNARLGAALFLQRLPNHSFTIHSEANKLLVPSPYQVNTVKEKLEQITLSAGIEYAYLSMFKLRGGYFHEFESHGNNRYVTAGLGLEYNVFQLDFSYLFPVSGQRSPLENTLRFTLLFNFDVLRQPQPKHK
jgi:hypothetical protein